MGRLLAYSYTMSRENGLPSSAWRRQRLAELLRSVTDRDGAQPKVIDGVQVWRRTTSMPRHPVVYQPNIVFVGQGHKRGYLGDQVYRFDPRNYLVVPVPLPFECEIDASPEEPMLTLTLAVDPTMLGEMLLEMDEAVPPESGKVPRGIYSTPLTPEISDSVIRLVECLRSPLDSRILGPQIVREVVYRVLRGKHGDALRALASRNEQFTRIARVLRGIHGDCAQPIQTEDLARQAGMSTSVFHHNFKLVTATSPLQYVKRVRLHRARTMMTHEGLNASAAAARVGYESASQFGREFKRLFGLSPIQDTANLRKRLALEAA
jgi:AraC-like DNA-binding protein